MLIDVRNVIELEDSSLLGKLKPPHPIDVTKQMLGCFHEKYDLFVKEDAGDDSLPIVDIAEELWIYSTLLELLAEPEDVEYLSVELQNIQTNIEEMLRMLTNKLPSEDISQLTDMCNNVFKGKRFDDVLFNELIENYVVKN